MDKISIIIPVYNCEKYLDECLCSIIGQTYKNFEVLIVNDGSTDSSKEIIKKYADNDLRFKFIDNSQNNGQSYCRNIALKLATGDYLFFIDADDVIDLNCLKILLDLLKSNDADVSISNYKTFVNSIKKPIAKKESLILDNYSLMQDVAICSKIQTFSWGRLFKRKLFDDVAYPEGRIFEDVYLITFVLSRASKCVYTDEVLYFYRTNESSSSRRLDLYKIQSYFLSIEQKADFINKNYPNLLKDMCNSFFEVFSLAKVHKIKSKNIPNYKSTKLLYKKAVGNAGLLQKMKFIALFNPILYFFVKIILRIKNINHKNDD